MQKKLVFFISSLSSGGAERVVSVLSKQMLNHFEQVEIVTYFDLPVFYALDSKVKLECLERKTHSKSVLVNCKYLRKHLNETRPTVLISFMAPFNILALLSVPWRRDYPVIVADRNDPRYECRNLMRRVLRYFLYKYKADRVVVQTKNNTRFYPSRVRRKIEVIYNPISIQSEKIGCALSVPKQKLLVNVARLERQKNQKMLLRSFKGVFEKHPEYRLIIYGEGQMREELLSYSKTLGIEDYVFFPGRESDIIEKIKVATIFVLSSDYEGMSNSMLEAMCIGLPVVSTEVSGAIDLITDNVNGSLVPIGDEVLMTEAILSIIEDETKRMNLATNAVKVSSLLDVNNITDKWVKCISSAAAKIIR